MSPFIRLADRERALSLPDDSVAMAAPDVPAHTRGETPRQALNEILRASVSTSPCYVLFSGGRDSSVLLAAAVTVARAVGADDPIPVTGIHPDDPESDEREWQDRVLTHLQIGHRVVKEFHGEQSLLSESSVASLAANGLIWPPAVHVQGAFVAELPAGSLVTGEGGDTYIGARRITPFAAAVRAHRPRASVREARALMHRDKQTMVDAFVAASPWLTPVGRDAARELIVTIPREPLPWSRALLATTRLRTQIMAEENFVALLGGLGFPTVNPLAHPRFVAALAREGGRLGLGYRTQMFRRLFCDLLPDDVLARTTKASFNTARWGVRERQFAEVWTGAGVDPEYIDAERLRDDWLSENPSPLGDLHLHAGWLADHELPFDGHGA